MKARIDVTITDDSWVPAYIEVVHDIAAKHGGKYITRSGNIDTLERYGLSYALDWQLSGEPFLTSRGALTDAVAGAVRDVAGIDAELSTGGGTSDGRFIAPTGAAVVELGPVNATIHKINEHTAVAELEALTAMYRSVLDRLLGER